MEDAFPPDFPVWVEKSEATTWPEKDIDATETGDILLQWILSDEDDIAKYLIFRGVLNDSSLEIDFEKIDIIDLNNPFESPDQYLDESAVVNQRYYYYLLAEDSGENLSDPSDTLDYMLLPSVYPSVMIPSSLNDIVSATPDLTWSYNYGTAMEDYVITLLDYDSKEFIVRDWFQPGNYVGSGEDWTFTPYWRVVNGDSTWMELLSMHRYQWRIDQHADYEGNIEKTGSESAWAYFTVE